MAWPRRTHGYGRILPTHRWQGRPRWAAFWAALKWWLGAALLVTAAWYFLSAPPAPEPPQADSERIAARFVVCGQGGSNACAPDGDTIILGTRHIRIIGIDAPELHPPRCPAEQAQGEAARAALIALLNQGPFFLTGPDPAARDEYGRELHNLVRARPDGTVQSIADDLVAAKVVRPYLRGPRVPWC